MAFPAGTILAATKKSQWSSQDQSGFPTGVVAIDPHTGKQVLVSEGGSFVTPTYFGVPTGAQGVVYVSDLEAGVAGKILSLDLTAGKQVVVSEGGLINGPNALAWYGSYLYVVNQGATSSGGSSGKVHTLVRVDPVRGWQTLVSETPSGFAVPTGIRPWRGMDLLICDEPGNVQGQDLGKLWKIDAVTGLQTLVAYGDGFDHPVDLAVEAAGTVLIGNTGREEDSYLGSITRLNLNVRNSSVKLATFGPDAGLDSLAVGADGTIYVGFISHGAVLGKIMAVNPQTGNTREVTSGGYLSAVEGICVL